MRHLLQPLHRRAFLRGSLLLSLTAASPLRTRLGEDALAKNNTGKKPNSAAARANGFIDQCFLIGGTPEVSVKPGGTTVFCNNGDGTGNTCTFTKKSYRCHSNAPDPNDVPDLAPDPGPTIPTTPVHLPDVPLEPADGEITQTSSRQLKRGRSRKRRA